MLAEPVLKDHIFEGWYTRASFDTDTKLENNAAPSVDTTYYAKWAVCDHSVSYVAEDNVITEHCGCSRVTNTLTLNASEDLTYDGTAKECTIEKSENWQDQTEVAVEYYSSADKLSGAPTNAGEYTATVTVQGAMASVNFTIAKAEQDISYVTASVSKRVGAANFTNELTKTVANGAISYASSDESVAKVNAATGEVTVIGIGRAAITATAAETENYNEATASYTLTVTRRHSSPSAVTPEPTPEPTPEETVKFADVSTSAYYYDAFKWAVEHDVTDGMSATMFGPYEPCTRAEIVTFLYRAYQGK